MKLAFVSVLCVVLFAGIFVVDAKAADKLPDPESLLKKSVKAMYTNNEESIYVMKLISSSGDTTTRKMKIWFKSDNENEAKLLIKFIEPADIRGTGFLTVGAKGKPTDQYLYLPALKKARKLGGTSNSDEPFLGSDFSMADLSVEKSDGLEYKVAGVKKCDGGDCYEVVGSPKPGASVSGYSKKIYLIKKDSGIATRAEFYNAGGQLEKVMTIKNITKEGAVWVVNQIEMKNQQTNHVTLLEFEKRDRSKKLSDSLFTVSNLERN